MLTVLKVTNLKDILVGCFDTKIYQHAKYVINIYIYIYIIYLFIYAVLHVILGNDIVLIRFYSLCGID